MSTKQIALSALVVACATALMGCAAEPKLSYTPLPSDGYDGKGIPFVVPRTVVRVVPSVKESTVESIAFTPVPVATSADGSAQLPTYVATDSTGGWSWTPTTVTSVSYADDLIVSAIGTQVTDNRKEAIDVVVSAAGLLGAFAGSGTGCNAPRKPLKPFTIGKLEGGSVPDADCWAYSVEKQAMQFIARKPHPVADLASIAEKVSWFPIPACQEYRIKVFQCADRTCTAPLADSTVYETVLSLSDGEWYQRIPLPSKGKISLRPDFCGADVTNDSVVTSNYGLLKQVITDVKAEKKK
ncbi:MAG: hypothetical protein QM740_21185 [Acidovorax sp.]